jgi:glycosyltransferase involved in cell wall biosynthesis
LPCTTGTTTLRDEKGGHAHSGKCRTFAFDEMKKAIVTVTNDLTTDQRVDRVCNTLVKLGFEVTLVGRKLKGSLPLQPRKYKTKRMRLIFRRGPAFYAEYNKRLLLYLLFHHCDLLVSNDTDSLPAVYLDSRISVIPHIHDCHEYFRGVPELVGRSRVTAIWKRIEDYIFPKLKYVYAVNDSIANLYHAEYGNEIKVLRNVPYRREDTVPLSKKKIGIRQGQKVILYQGAVNVDRGLEEAIMAMKFVQEDAVLVIIGTGDIFEQLKHLTFNEGLNDRVIFTGQVPFPELHSYTLMADIGLSIEKDVGINYHYCLPNKLLDYIQAGIPVLVSPLPEMKAIVDKFDIGAFVESHEPELLAAQFDRMLHDGESLIRYRINERRAASELCWENEEGKLETIVREATAIY